MNLSANSENLNGPLPVQIITLNSISDLDPDRSSSLLHDTEFRKKVCRIFSDEGFDVRNTEALSGGHIGVKDGLVAYESSSDLIHILGILTGFDITDDASKQALLNSLSKEREGKRKKKPGKKKKTGGRRDVPARIQEIPDKKTRKSAQILHALSHRVRLKILAYLTNGNESGKIKRCVKDIYETLGLEQSDTSLHLKVLTMAGITKAKREGKKSYYSLNKNCRSAIENVGLIKENHKWLLAKPKRVRKK